MSLGFVPVFNPSVPRLHFDSEGVSLLREIEILDEIAASNGCKPLSHFADNREIPEGISGAPDELDEIMGEWHEWFEPDEALHCVDSVIRVIESAPPRKMAVCGIDEVLCDLNDLQRCLTAAMLHGSRFRLEVFS